MASSVENSIESIEVVPTGTPVGAEVLGLDLCKPVSDEVKEKLGKLWGEHMVLLFRNQDLSDENILATAEVFGGQQIAGSRAFFLKAGYKAGESDRVSKHAGISLVSNLDQDGKPAKVTAGVGSLEALWHTDNSYVEVPPNGTLLWSEIVPTDGGGETSFNNQYQAYNELSDELKEAIAGKHICHDNLRNTAGRLRPTAKEPESREEITGPAHPIVRIHPLTGNRCLYLGRRYGGNSSYIQEMPDDEGDALLEKLWAHATQEHLRWTHHWQPHDLILWDNRCTMHQRNPVDHTQVRVMHRALIKGEQIISAWDAQAAAE
jgi:taurine dioxygenase